MDAKEIPYWVMAGAHAAIAAGTFFGGWRIVKTSRVRSDQL